MALDKPRGKDDPMQQLTVQPAGSAELRSFAATLYAGADPEGLAPLGPSLLATLAADVFAFIAEKPRGHHKVRVRQVAGPESGAAFSVLEIVNDDMPFLVDSVMGEIQAQGLGARLVLHPVVPNIQTSWVKLGPEGAAACLASGCNDLGGTLMNESISRAAGSEHGQELPPERMDALIGSLHRAPRQRTTLYGDVPPGRRRAGYDAPELQPLVVTPAGRVQAAATV